MPFRLILLFAVCAGLMGCAGSTVEDDGYNFYSAYGQQFRVYDPDSIVRDD